MGVELRHRLFSRHRLPVVLQAEAAECALACLAMVAMHQGHREKPDHGGGWA